MGACTDRPNSTANVSRVATAGIIISRAGGPILDRARTTTRLGHALMRERATKSAIIKHSINLGGHRTSVSLESEFWKAARDNAEERHETVPQLLTSIDRGRQHPNP